MAIIVAVTSGQEVADTTTVTPTLPAHTTGDLILVWVSKDDGAGGTPTVSGGSWTVTDTTTEGGDLTGLVGTTGANSARGGFLWRVAASASETAPTITSSDADSWAWVCAVVRGAPATSPIDVIGTPNTDTADPYVATGVTTGTNNCLVFYSAHSDGGVSTTALPGLMNLSNRDSGSDCCAVAWTFQKTAGATGSKTWYAAGTADDTVFYCFAVKDGSSGALLPVYTDSTLCTLITPNKATTTLTSEAATPTSNASAPLVPTSRAADSVFQEDTSGGPSYVDYTTAASNATDADVVPYPATEAAGASGTGDCFLIGDNDPFYAVRFDRLSCTNGVAGVVVWEYMNASGSWRALKNVYDGTTSFTATLADYQILSFDRPTDWGTNTINGATRYWIRARCSTVWTTNPTISQIFVSDCGIVYDAITAVADVGVNPFEARLGSSPSITGAALSGATLQWNAAKNFSATSLYLISSYLYRQPRDKIDAGLVKNGGVLFMIGDTTQRYRAWCVGGIDYTTDRPDKRNVVGIAPTNTATDFVTDPSIDLTAIRNHLMVQNCQYGPCIVDWGHIVQAGVIQVYGGSVDNPVTFAELVKVANSFPVPLIDENEAKEPIVFGGASGSLYVDMELFSLSFPTYAGDDATKLLWHVDNSAVNMRITLDCRTGDTVQIRNGLISGTSWWLFEVASTAQTCTIDMSGLTLVGAVVVLRDITTWTGMSFIDSRSVTLHADTTLLDCSFVLREANTFTFTGTGQVLTDCAIDCAAVASGSAGIHTATLSVFDGCAFTCNSGGHAIQITTAGSYTLAGTTFSGFGADGSNSAAIYNNSGGSVTINITGGGDTPTIRNGAGASTTIVNARTVRVTALDAEDSSAVSGARVALWATTGTSVSMTRSGSTVAVTHASHGYTTGQKVVIFGADQGEYNGIKTITVTGSNNYEFTVAGTPATPATGTITSHRCILDGTTSVAGVLEDTAFPYTSDLAVTGRVRLGNVYRTSPLSGTITSAAGYDVTAFLVAD